MNTVEFKKVPEGTRGMLFSVVPLFICNHLSCILQEKLALLYMKLSLHTPT